MDMLKPGLVLLDKKTGRTGVVRFVSEVSLFIEWAGTAEKGIEFSTDIFHPVLKQAPDHQYTRVLRKDSLLKDATSGPGPNTNHVEEIEIADVFRDGGVTG